MAKHPSILSHDLKQDSANSDTVVVYFGYGLSSPEEEKVIPLCMVVDPGDHHCRGKRKYE